MAMFVLAALLPKLHVVCVLTMGCVAQVVDWRHALGIQQLFCMSHRYRFGMMAWNALGCLPRRGKAIMLPFTHIKGSCQARTFKSNQPSSLGPQTEIKPTRLTGSENRNQTNPVDRTRDSKSNPWLRHLCSILPTT